LDIRFDYTAAASPRKRGGERRGKYAGEGRGCDTFALSSRSSELLDYFP
jgi:hypothetical protein